MGISFLYGAGFGERKLMSKFAILAVVGNGGGPVGFFEISDPDHPRIGTDLYC